MLVHWVGVTVLTWRPKALLCFLLCACVCRNFTHITSHLHGTKFDTQLYSVAIAVVSLSKNFTHIAPVYPAIQMET